LPDFIFLELEFIMLRQDLHLVGHLMRADLVLLVKIDLLLVLTNVEVPRSDRITEAADGLVRLYNVTAHGHECSNDITFLFHRLYYFYYFRKLTKSMK
jgi:hypothetical protein